MPRVAWVLYICVHSSLDELTGPAQLKRKITSQLREGKKADRCRNEGEAQADYYVLRPAEDGHGEVSWEGTENRGGVGICHRQCCMI